jgi:hypothetical protein
VGLSSCVIVDKLQSEFLIRFLLLLLGSFVKQWWIIWTMLLVLVCWNNLLLIGCCLMLWILQSLWVLNPRRELMWDLLLCSLWMMIWEFFFKLTSLASNIRSKVFGVLDSFFHLWEHMTKRKHIICWLWCSIQGSKAFVLFLHMLTRNKGCLLYRSMIGEPCIPC